jgi:hypothetical protein
MNRSYAVAAAACVVALAVPAAAEAVTTQTFTTSESEFTPGVRNQGWWSATEPNSDDNANYVAGSTELGPHRNFFSFDLTSACTAGSVRLQLTRFDQTGPADLLGVRRLNPCSDAERQRGNQPDDLR